jgi:hypothetical protein
MKPTPIRVPSRHVIGNISFVGYSTGFTSVYTSTSNTENHYSSLSDPEVLYGAQEESATEFWDRWNSDTTSSASSLDTPAVPSHTESVILLNIYEELCRKDTITQRTYDSLLEIKYQLQIYMDSSDSSEELRRKIQDIFNARIPQVNLDESDTDDTSEQSDGETENPTLAATSARKRTRHYDSEDSSTDSSLATQPPVLKKKFKSEELEEGQIFDYSPPKDIILKPIKKEPEE